MTPADLDAIIIIALALDIIGAVLMGLAL